VKKYINKLYFFTILTKTKELKMKQNVLEVVTERFITEIENALSNGTQLPWDNVEGPKKI
jgi:hypothetical protein